jgi:Trp operon repressor
LTKLPKKPLSIKRENKILADFDRFLAAIDKKDDWQIICESLLTPTERLVLAKRFQVGILLLKGCSYQRIEQELDTSASTIARIANIFSRQPRLVALVHFIFLYPEENKPPKEKLSPHPKVNRALKMMGFKEKTFYEKLGQK